MGAIAVRGLAPKCILGKRTPAATPTTVQERIATHARYLLVKHVLKLVTRIASAGVPTAAQRDGWAVEPAVCAALAVLRAPLPTPAITNAAAPIILATTAKPAKQPGPVLEQWLAG